MSVALNIKIEGLEELEEAFKRAPKMVSDETSKAIQKSVLTVQSNAVKEAPVNKQGGGGNLRQNIRSRMMNNFSGIIEARAPYSLFVHEGTRPHIIRSKGPWALRNKRTGQVFGRVVHHPGTTANKFFLRAVQASSKKIGEFFDQAIANVLKTFPK